MKNGVPFVSCEDIASIKGAISESGQGILFVTKVVTNIKYLCVKFKSHGLFSFYNEPAVITCLIIICMAYRW